MTSLNHKNRTIYKTMANETPTLYSNFERVKDWAVEKFADKEQLAYALSDVAFSGDYDDLLNKPDLSVYTTYAYVYSYVADALSDISLDGYATEAYVMGKVNELIDGAPAALDTLNELAAAINDDANFASTVTTALGNKANSADVYSKTDIQNMSYITMDNVSACGYLTAVPAEYVTDSELSGMSYITMDNVSACGYATALSQAEMDTLFPISNS